MMAVSRYQYAGAQGRWVTVGMWILAGVALIAALLLLLPQTYKLSFDFTKYLAIASGLETGTGFTEPDGRPAFYRSGYTLFLTGLIKVFGRDLSAAVLSTMIFAALIPAMLIVAGRYLRDVWTGVLAAGLVIGSPNFLVLAPRHLDPIWPALLVMALALLLYGMRVRSLWPWIGCAVVTVLAVSVKEFSTLFAPAVVAIAVICGVERRFTSSFLLVFFIGVSGWLAAVVVINGEPFPPQWLFNYAGKAGADIDKQTAAHGNLVEYGVYGLRQLFVAAAEDGGILRQYAMGIGLGAAVVMVLLLALFRRQPQDIALAVLLLAFLPIAIVTSARGMRLMQSLWFQILCFLSLAYCVQLVVSGASAILKFNRSSRARAFGSMGITIALLAAVIPYAWQHDVEAGRLANEPRLMVWGALAQDDSGVPREVELAQKDSGVAQQSDALNNGNEDSRAGELTGGDRGVSQLASTNFFTLLLSIDIQAPCNRVGEVLKQTTPAAAVVQSDHRKVLETIRWEAPAYQRLGVLTGTRIDPLSAADRRKLHALAEDLVLIDMDHPQLTTNNRFKLISRPLLEQAIADPQTRLVLTHRAIGLRQLIESSAGFTRVATVKSRWGCRVYQANGKRALLPSTPLVTTSVTRYLSWLAGQHPAVHDEIDAWIRPLL